MAIPFSPRAALCTFVVVAGFGAAVVSQLPGGLFGLIGWERDGLLTIERGGSMPDEDERNEIVSAVLSHEARYVARDAACVGLADQGEALTDQRQDIAEMQRMAAGALPEARPAMVAELDRLRNPTRRWLRPTELGANALVPVADENARALQAAETAIIGMPPGDRVDLMLDVGSLPDKLQGRSPGCETLLFTTPAVAGNVAFVETHFSCRDIVPSRCSTGKLHALTRESGRWRIVAWTITWVA